jgi:hypothetical protein
VKCLLTKGAYRPEADADKSLTARFKCEHAGTQLESLAESARGVTNHHSRLIIPDVRVTDERSFMAMMDAIRAALLPALEAALTSCR